MACCCSFAFDRSAMLLVLVVAVAPGLPDRSTGLLLVLRQLTALLPAAAGPETPRR